MNGISVLGMFFQGDSLSAGNTKLLMFLVGMVAFALLIQAIALIAIAIGAAKARNRALEMAEELRLKFLPMIDNTHEMIRDSSPKIKVITENLVETSHVVRNKAAEFDVTMTDVNKRARAQAATVDDMVGKTLATTADIVGTVQHIVQVPVMQVAGLMNGFKAAMDVMIGKARQGFGTRHPVEPDREIL